MIVCAIGFLPPTCETWAEFQSPDFFLPPPHQCVGEWKHTLSLEYIGIESTHLEEWGQFINMGEVGLLLTNWKPLKHNLEGANMLVQLVCGVVLSTHVVSIFRFQIFGLGMHKLCFLHLI